MPTWVLLNNERTTLDLDTVVSLRHDPDDGDDYQYVMTADRREHSVTADEMRRIRAFIHSRMSPVRTMADLVSDDVVRQFLPQDTTEENHEVPVDDEEEDNVGAPNNDPVQIPPGMTEVDLTHMVPPGATATFRF